MAGSRWGGDGKSERKIGWEMRDCTERNSQPAGPACCLRDCKLSLRMQTDKQDRHHLPILPSTAETVTRASHILLPSYSLYPSLYFQDFFFLLFLCLWTCIFTNSLIYFLYLLHAAAPPPHSVCLLVSCVLIKWASLQYTFPSHCSMVRCFSIGGKESLGSIRSFTSLPV